MLASRVRTSCRVFPTAALAFLALPKAADAPSAACTETPASVSNPCLVSRDTCTHTCAGTHLLGIGLQPCHRLQVLVQAPRSSRRLCPKFLRFLSQGGGVLQQSRVGKQRSRGSLENKMASAPELTSGGAWWTCWWLLVTSMLSTRLSSWLTVPIASL